MTAIVGVINLSPESRNRDSVVPTGAPVLERAHEFRAVGASTIEIGARSSSVESPMIDDVEERRRLLPIVRMLKHEDFTLSVDTWSPATAAAAAQDGADFINYTGSDLPVEGLREIARTDRRTACR